MCSLHLEKQGRCHRIVICCNNNSNHEDHTPCESPLLARAPSCSHPVILFGETRFGKIRKQGHTAGKQQKQGPSLVFPDFPTPQTAGEGRMAGERERRLPGTSLGATMQTGGRWKQGGTQRGGKMKGPGLWDREGGQCDQDRPALPGPAAFSDLKREGLLLPGKRSCGQGATSGSRMGRSWNKARRLRGWKNRTKQRAQSKQPCLAASQ